MPLPYFFQRDKVVVIPAITPASSVLSDPKEVRDAKDLAETLDRIAFNKCVYIERLEAPAPWGENHCQKAADEALKAWKTYKDLKFGTHQSENSVNRMNPK